MTLCSFAFIMTICAIARPAMAQCDQMTDAQIVADIYGKIKADSGLASQVSHINVVGVAGLATVKLQGWADNQNDFDKVKDIAMSLKCLKLNVNGFEPAPPPANSPERSSKGCAPGTKPCGDVCIPEGDPCNIGGARSIYLPIFRFDLDRSLAIFEPVSSCSLN